MRSPMFSMALALAVMGQAECPGNPNSTPTPVPHCADLEVQAQFEACSQATDQETCEAAGGTWTYVGTAPFEQCLCPTGEENCPCTSGDQCASLCVAPLDDDQCQTLSEGMCAPYAPTVGCFCLFGADGHASPICID